MSKFGRNSMQAVRYSHTRVCVQATKAIAAKIKRMVLIRNENVQQRPFGAFVVLVRLLAGAGTSLIMCQLFSSIVVWDLYDDVCLILGFFALFFCSFELG